MIVPDEGYSYLLTMIVPDEGYSYILTDCTWWRLFQSFDWLYLMEVILIFWLWLYLMEVIPIFWLWLYLMKVIHDRNNLHQVQS
jgi:hypothetical protein